jgi:hypothetical protein
MLESKLGGGINSFDLVKVGFIHPKHKTQKNEPNLTIDLFISR